MAIVESNKQNQATGDVVRTRSKFPLSYEFFDTHRFGEYHPHFVFDGVEGDEDLRLRCSHDVRSYTLKAPLLQDVQLKKDYFMIPLQSILPRNWDKYNAIPVKGDDVDSEVGCGVADFWTLVGLATSGLYSSYRTLLSSSVLDQRVVAGLLRCLIFGEYFYSSGSLLNSLGHRGCTRFFASKAGVEYSYDEFFDSIITFLVSRASSFDFYLDASGTRYRCVLDGSPFVYSSTLVYVDLHTALQIMRDNLHFLVFAVNGVGNGTTLYSPLSTELASWSLSVAPTGRYNLARPLAYQIVCSHFYSNDHIDYIFSATLYRELIGNYVEKALSSATPRYFTFNGISYEYDYCSSHYFIAMIQSVASTASALLYDINNDAKKSLLCYFSAIFSYKRSLRFLDYFTGTRSYPLAVGDVNIDVTTSAGNSYVSAVDVTKGISRQRLLNAVNRVGAKWENYIELMSGRKPAPDFHNPFYLGHTSDVIFGSESEYTGNASNADAQNVTSVLRSNGGRYEFNVDFIDRPVIILGLSYYDLPRVYGRAVERQTLILDRYDMFNKYMQFVGDQPVSRVELGVLGINDQGFPSDTTFSYQNRDMQYKQRFNQLAGGFGVNSTQLDNWLYRADDVRSRHDVIDPDFIRSYNSEFDKFFVSLTGFSLGTYWHFIVRNINDCTCSRPMAFAPSIL